MAFSDSFVSSFEKVLPTATASGASAAQKRIEKEVESAEKKSRLAAIKSLSLKQGELIGKNPDIEDNIKSFVQEQIEVGSQIGDPDMAEAHYKSVSKFITDAIGKKVSERDPVAKSIAEFQRIKEAAGEKGDQETLDFANAKIQELIGSKKEQQDPTSNIIDQTKPKQQVSEENAIITESVDKTVPEEAIDKKVGDVSDKGVSKEEIKPSNIKGTLTNESVHRTASQKIKDFKIVRDQFGNRTRANILEEERLKLEMAEEIKDFKKKHDLAESEDITLMETFRFMQQFDRSENELRNFDPNFDTEGYEGWIIRRGAEVANYFDELPETKALRIKVLPMANAMAREIEGGKVTDADREIYANEFADAIKNPSATNVRLLSSRYLNIIDKYGNTDGSIPRQLRLLSKSSAPSMRKMVAQVVEEYPEMAQEIYGEDFEVIE